MDTPQLDAFAVRGTVFDRHFSEDLSPQSLQHAWWTGRFEFPLDPPRQQQEPIWLTWLTQQNIPTTLLYDPAAKLPLQPELFAASRAVSLDDVAGLDCERDVPRFVRAAISRIKQMADTPDQSELLWMHAGGLPVDATSLAYEALYADDAPLPRSTEATADLEEDEEQPEVPRFWRRNRASPRELAGAQLRGGGWQTAGTVETQVDWQHRRDLYSGQVTQWDAWVGRILQAVTDLRQTAPVLLIFTAAAGEHLGEHAALEPSASLFEEQIHVPLIVELPLDEAYSGRRQQLSQAVDLPVTLMDWLQVSIPAGNTVDGCSLLPVIRDDQPLPREAVFVGDSSFAGARTPDFYYRRQLNAVDTDPQEMVFVKPDDRWDADSMLRQYIDVADELGKKWQEFVAGIRGRA